MSNPDEFSSTFSSAVNHANTLKRAIQGCAWGEYTKEVSSYPDLLDALDARRERYSEAAQKLSRRKDRMTQKRYDAEEQRRQAEGKIKQEEFEAREKIRQEEFRAAQKRYQQEIKECERIAEQQKEHRKQTPSARSPYVVAIMPAGKKANTGLMKEYPATFSKPIGFITRSPSTRRMRIFRRSKDGWMARWWPLKCEGYSGFRAGRRGKFRPLDIDFLAQPPDGGGFERSAMLRDVKEHSQSFYHDRIYNSCCRDDVDRGDYH